MAHRKFLYAALASALIAGSAAPAFAQGYLDRMKEAAARRAENKAVMDAEHPDNKTATATTAKPADATPADATAAAATPAPATTAAAPAAPATTAAATPAPATPAA